MGLTQLYLPTEQQVIISSMKDFIFLMKIKYLTEKQIFSLMRNQFSMWMLFVAGGGKTYTMVGQPVTLFTYSSCPPMYSIFVIEPSPNIPKHNPKVLIFNNFVYLFLLPSYVLYTCHRTQYRFPETQPSVSIFNNISLSSLPIILLQICHQTLNQFLSNS